MRKQKIPQILAPAGDMDALVSAVIAGADAIYLGLDLFNARIRAKNFTLDNVGEAIRLCHAHGVRVYVTLNIAIYDKEINSVLAYVDRLWVLGVDALIVSDLGIASLIRENYPNFEIHASTQCSAHSLSGVEFLNEKMGARQVVLARELPENEIKYISSKSKARTEIFVHGAHCMSFSGQCLMSYAMGGRSGNRGECAQPCRLPYKINGKSGYPLSLKDMSLSGHIDSIISSGVDTLKIEGRMKSADYVGGTVSVWRRLIDEGRNATKTEKSTLEGLFSRQGFTDGYFTGKMNSSMLGIRSEENKETTRGLQIEKRELKKVEIQLQGSFILGKKAEITLIWGEKSVTVYGDTVEMAINAPTSREDIIKSLSKLGQTPFVLGSAEIEKSENIMVRVSTLNALRREAIEKLFDTGRTPKNSSYTPKKQTQVGTKFKSAMFAYESQIPDNCDYFDIIYVYIDRYFGDKRVNGVCIPPIVLDSEWGTVKEKLIMARENGIEYALATNVGQIKPLLELGFKVNADFRFNVFNEPCVRFLREQGIESVMLSPELTLPQINDLKGNSVIAYGKIPVMTTFKCMLKDTFGCDKCKGYIQDRQSASFYAEGIFGHRSVIYNSVPIYMADRLSMLKNHSLHFIFTSEARQECYDVIEAYKNGIMPKGSIKRIK